jgi:U32 family peptidase
MKIVSGASSIKTFLERIEAGVDEIFCGYIPEEWIDRYKYLVSPNRRWGKLANFTSIDKLKLAIKIAHRNNVKVSFTLNAHVYNDIQMDLIKKIIDDAIGAGIDAVIVADLGVLLFLRERYPSLPIHVSTGGTVFNSEAIDFYNNLGVKRIVFPRSLKPEEIAKMTNNYPSLEFEVFMSGARCANIDGFCFFEHAIMYFANTKNMDNYPMCSLDYGVEVITKNKITKEDYQRISTKFVKMRNFNVHPKACGACYLYEFSRNNIEFVKIPARASSGENNRKKVIQETRFIKEVISSIGDFENEVDFQAYVRNKFYDSFNIKCTKKGVNCYY